jgi:Flp pilus assembly protein TadD
MRCPKCGLDQPDADTCAACGVVFRKRRDAPATGAAPTRVRPSPLPESARVAVLRRAGLVLILVGAADILYMMYSLARGRGYSSSLNLFALVAGILVYRGSLGAARAVANAASFMLAGGLGAAVLIPALVPWDFVGIWARLAPADLVVTALFTGASALLMLWLRGQLTGEALAGAFRDSGKEPPRTVIPSAGGFAMILVLGIVLRVSLHGDSAQEAMAQARQRVGPGYRFFVTRMNLSYTHDGKSGEATVLAYRPSEIRSVRVRFGSAERAESPATGLPSAGSPSRDDTGPGATHLSHGNELLGAGNLQGAIDEYSVAISANGNDADAYLRRAQAYGKKGEYGKAVADADTVMVLDPDRIGSYEMADWILVHQGDWDGITSRWTRFIANHPSSGKAYLERGGAYHHKGDDDASRRDIEQACALQEESACQILKGLAPPTAR